MQHACDANEDMSGMEEKGDGWKVFLNSSQTVHRINILSMQYVHAPKTQVKFTRVNIGKQVNEMGSDKFLLFQPLARI